jgi:hypothetical protein
VGRSVFDINPLTGREFDHHGSVSASRFGHILKEHPDLMPSGWRVYKPTAPRTHALLAIGFNGELREVKQPRKPRVATGGGNSGRICRGSHYLNAPISP